MEFNYYPKINTIYKRDLEHATKKGAPLIVGEYSTPEFEYLKDLKWRAEEKIDGTNVGIHYDGYEVVFTGHKEKSKLPDHLVKKLTNIFSMEVLKEITANAHDCTISFYGEGIGQKIQDQGSRYMSKDVDFILFDVRVGKWWLEREAVESIAKQLNVRCAPVIGEFTFDEAIAYVKKGFKSLIAEDKTLQAEGLVLKSPLGLLDRSGQRLVSKIKVRDFKNLEI